MNIADTIERNGLTATIYYDELAEDPSKDFLSKIYILDSVLRWNQCGYSAVAVMPGDDEDAFAIDELKSGSVVYPVYTYDQSFKPLLRKQYEKFVALSLAAILTDSEVTLPQFDGLMVIDKDTIKQEYGESEDAAERAKACILAELDTLRMYQEGEIYGYVITDGNSEELDSCWGFYGIDSIQEEIDRRIKELGATVPSIES